MPKYSSTVEPTAAALFARLCMKELASLLPAYRVAFALGEGEESQVAGLGRPGRTMRSQASTCRSRANALRMENTKMQRSVRPTLGESVVRQVLAEGLFSGDAPPDTAWVILYEAGRAQPEARPWSWIDEHLRDEGEHLRLIRSTMIGDRSLILFVPVRGDLEVLRQHTAWVN